jgi:colanic acid/amylovoran biosynthesis glycosyltransferase
MPQPTTIAYLTSHYARAGDTFIRGEVKQLRRLGHAVHTFSIRRPGPEEVVSDEIRREREQTIDLLEAGALKLALAGLRRAIAAPRRSLEVVRTAIRTVPAGIPGRWMRRVSYWLEAAYLADRLEARGVGHLHNHIGESSAVVAMLAAHFADIPYSLTIHGPSEFDWPTLLALDEKIGRAAFVAAISEFTRSQLYRWCAREHWPKIRVIRCGLDESFLARDIVPVPARPRLISVGRLAEQKGHLLLIDAAARLRRRGLEFELVLVGDGPLRDAIEALIDRLDLRDRVRITGYLGTAEVRRELEAARAMVLPSFAEGLPVVIMEAMAMGRPVISTYVAGIPELVEPGRSGWLVPPGAVEPLVEAMAEALAAGPAELEAMGRSGAARVAERHDAAAEARKLADLIAGPAPADAREESSTAPAPALAGR